MKTKLLIISLLFFIQSRAQIPEIILQQCYNVTDYDYPAGVCEAENGYAILTDVYNAIGAPNWHPLHDFHFRLIDTTGNTIFEKCFGGSKSERPYRIIRTGDNNFLLFGKTNSNDGDIQSEIWGYNDFWVVKINSVGEILFSNIYGSTGDDTPGNIILLPNNEFMFCGTIEGGGGDINQYSGGTDMWLCRCNQQGEMIWQKTIGNEKNDKCNVIYRNSAGNILIGGSKQALTDSDNYDARIIEMDMQGNFLSDTVYTGENSEEIKMFEELTDGYIVLGSSLINSYYSYQILVMKTGYAGNIKWKKLFGEYWDDSPTYITHLSQGGYIVTGTSENAPCNNSLPNKSDVWMLKLNESGNMQWQQCYGGVNDEIMLPGSIIKKSDYRYVIVASSESGNSGDVICNSNGSNVWLFDVQRCPGYEPGIPALPMGPDTVYSANQPETSFYIDPPANAWTFNWRLEPDTAGNLTGYGLYAKVEWEPDFTGIVSVSAQSANYCGVSNWSEPKILQVYNTIGVGEIPVNGGLLKVYPNPAKDFVIFDVQCSKFESSVIKIMDVYGNEVDRMKITNKKTVWHTKDVIRGLYFYKIETCGEILSGKVEIQK